MIISAAFMTISLYLPGVGLDTPILSMFIPLNTVRLFLLWHIAPIAGTDSINLEYGPIKLERDLAFLVGIKSFSFHMSLAFMRLILLLTFYRILSIKQKINLLSSE